MTDKTSLGDRMKAYEVATGPVLVPRMPTIVRVDGKAFHTFTKRITADNDPSSEFGPSELMYNVMSETARIMCKQMQNVTLAYTQSDEISFLLEDYSTLEKQQWFGGKVQKIASVSASMATAYFNRLWERDFGCTHAWPEAQALFDSRVFQVPKEDVVNYFIWRQKDATRNSINFVARKYFSQKKLHGLNTDQVQELLWQDTGVNWNDLETWKKRGACVYKCEVDSGWTIDGDIPIFTQDRRYVEQFI